MRDFIVKILGFLACWLIFMTIVYAVNRKLFDSFFSKNYTGYETIIIGDSRCLHLNDKIIDNSLQLSSPAETAKVMYKKLEYFSELNNFSKAIISFNHGQIAPLWDKNLLTDYHQIHKAYPISSPLELYENTQNISGATEILFKNMLTFNESYLFSEIFPQYQNIDNPVKILSGKGMKRIKETHKLSKFGRAVQDKKSIFYKKEFNKKENIMRKNLPEDYDFENNSNHLNYMMKIVQLCKEKNIKPYLLTMPAHPVYRNNIPENYLQRNRKIYRQLKKANKDLEHINLSDLFDEKPELFINSTHINELGGVSVSRIVSGKLK